MITRGEVTRPTVTEQPRPAAWGELRIDTANCEQYKRADWERSASSGRFSRDGNEAEGVCPRYGAAAVAGAQLAIGLLEVLADGGQRIAQPPGDRRGDQPVGR